MRPNLLLGMVVGEGPVALLSLNFLCRQQAVGIFKILNELLEGIRIGFGVDGLMEVWAKSGMVWFKVISKYFSSAAHGFIRGFCSHQNPTFSLKGCLGTCFWMDSYVWGLL